MTEMDAIFLSDHVSGCVTRMLPRLQLLHYPHYLTLPYATTMFAFIQSHYFVANILGFSLCRHCSNAERALADDTSPALIGKGSHVGNLFPSRHMWPQVFSRQCSVCHGTDIAPSMSVCPLRAIRTSRADRQLRPLSLYHTLHAIKGSRWHSGLLGWA